jgi:hypothetical protein
LTFSRYSGDEGGLKRNLILAAASLVLVAGLITASYTSAPRRTPPPRPEVGAPAPPLEGRTVEGQTMTLDPQVLRRPIVLYVTAPWQTPLTAEVNFEALSKLVSPQFVTIRATTDGDALKGLGNQTARLVIVPEDALGALYSDAEPSLVTIGLSGRIEGMWPSPFTPDGISRLESYFKVKLPGQQKDPYKCVDPYRGSQNSAGSIIRVGFSRLVCEKSGGWAFQ